MPYYKPQDDRTALRLIWHVLSTHPPHERLPECQRIVLERLIEMDSSINSQVGLLERLIEVAEKTENGGVWQTLFTEIHDRLLAESELEHQ